MMGYGIRPGKNRHSLAVKAFAIGEKCGIFCGKLSAKPDALPDKTFIEHDATFDPGAG